MTSRTEGTPSQTASTLTIRRFDADGVLISEQSTAIPAAVRVSREWSCQCCWRPIRKGSLAVPTEGGRFRAHPECAANPMARLYARVSS